MVITIPHLGNVYLAAKTLFEGLGLSYVLPAPSGRETLIEGSAVSPEEICLPFKLMMGNYLDAIRHGADTILITGSCGPCRFGEYCEMQMRTLRKLGHAVNFIVIDSPGEIGREVFFERIAALTGRGSFGSAHAVRAFMQAVTVMRLVDRIEADAHRLAGYEKERGVCKHLLHRCKRDANLCNDPQERIRILHSYSRALARVPLNSANKPLRVAIIGEIFTVIEPFSNLFLEDKLMDLGASSTRAMTPSWWLGDMLLKPTGLNSLHLRQASADYLPLYIGGHGRECVGEAVLAERAGMDGAIQVFPMGCMPEIVSKAIFPTLVRERDFPIMTLVVDEMTGEAGYVTRLEAFLDMLEHRRKKAEKAV